MLGNQNNDRDIYCCCLCFVYEFEVGFEWISFLLHLHQHIRREIPRSNANFLFVISLFGQKNFSSIFIYTEKVKWTFGNVYGFCDFGLWLKATENDFTIVPINYLSSTIDSMLHPQATHLFFVFFFPFVVVVLMNFFRLNSKLFAKLHKIDFVTATHFILQW